MEDEQQDRLARRMRRSRKGRLLPRSLMEHSDDLAERMETDGKTANRRGRRAALDQLDIDEIEDPDQ